VILARLGRRADAHADAEAARQRSDDPCVTYQVACVYALTSRTHPADREHAIELLRTALRDGYRDAKTLTTDADLDPIRDAPAVRAAIQAAVELGG
jgi:hypothetical protein